MRALHVPKKSPALSRPRLSRASTSYYGSAKEAWMAGASPAMAPSTWPALTFSAVLLISLAFGIGAADAHALLDHADPRVGNTVKSPRAVSLWFTQNLESGFSTIEVIDASGARVNAGNAAVDSSDRKLLRVPVKALPAGTYTVKWHVLSVDTHTTEGNFTFHVSP